MALIICSIFEFLWTNISPGYRLWYLFNFFADHWPFMKAWSCQISIYVTYPKCSKKRTTFIILLLNSISWRFWKNRRNTFFKAMRQIWRREGYVDKKYCQNILIPKTFAPNLPQNILQYLRGGAGLYYLGAGRGSLDNFWGRGSHFSWGRGGACIAANW